MMPSRVLAAVEQNGYALEYASETLRNDRDIAPGTPGLHAWGVVYERLVYNTFQTLCRRCSSVMKDCGATPAREAPMSSGVDGKLLGSIMLGGP